MLVYQTEHCELDAENELIPAVTRGVATLVLD